MGDWKNVQYKDGKFQTSNSGGGGGSTTFAGLDDVNFSNLQDGQIAKYDAQNEKWVNANESGGGGTVTDVEVDGVSVVNQQGVAEIQMPSVPSSLDDLDDVDLTNISDGDTLVYDAQNQEFVPGTPSGSDNVDDVQVNGTSVVDANKVAQITSYEEVTQAEYDALPNSKNSNGIAYFIKNAGDSGGIKHKYSTDEQVVGTWIDGKPIYERVIDCTEFSASANTWKDTGIDIPNGEYIVSCGFAQHNSISGAFLNIAFCKFDNSGNLLAYFVDGTYYWSRCLIQYTKITD